MAENIYLSKTPWTEKDDDFLRLHYVQLPQREMAVRLARTKGEIQRRLEKLDLKLTDEQKRLKKQAAAYKMREYIDTEIFWDDENNLYLKEYFPVTMNRVLVAYFNVTPMAIATQAHKLGLKKSKAFLKNLRTNVIPRLRYSYRTKKEVKNVQGAICASI